jgi:hypothetical protein
LRCSRFGYLARQQTPATHWWELKAGDAEVWRVHPDGSGLQQLSHVASAVDGAYRPRYSADGQWILYTLVDGEAGELWAIPADGCRPVQVLPGIEDEYHFDFGGAGPIASRRSIQTGGPRTHGV